MKKTLMIASALVLALAGNAYAQGDGGGGGGGGAGGGGRAGGGRGAPAACTDDAQKLCADKQGADRGVCLRTNIDHVTEACKTALQNGRGGGGGGAGGGGGGGRD
jgi:hypothetical protein